MNENIRKSIFTFSRSQKEKNTAVFYFVKTSKEPNKEYAKLIRNVMVCASKSRLVVAKYVLS